jgi:hypothetical protein
MGSCPVLIWVNIITLFCTVLIPLGYYIIHGVLDIRPEGSQIVPVANLSYSGVLAGLSSFTFAMDSQFMLTEIMGEMSEPAEFPQAYALISAPFQLAAFLVAGLGGYFFIGDKVAGMINENLPFGVPLQVAALCLCTHMLISYLIKGVVICGFFQTNLDPQRADPNDQRCSSWLSWNAFVGIILGAALLLANAVPFFGEAVHLLGALFTPLSCWMLPIAFYARVLYDAGEKRPQVSYAERAVIFAEFVFAAVLMVLGSVSSVQTIVDQCYTFGMPFSCHCENIWNTCACSSEHVGMDLMCNATVRL